MEPAAIMQLDADDCDVRYFAEKSDVAFSRNVVRAKTDL